MTSQQHVHLTVLAALHVKATSELITLRSLPLAKLALLQMQNSIREISTFIKDVEQEELQQQSKPS